VAVASDERIEQVRAVLRWAGWSEGWDQAIDPDMPAAVAGLQREVFAAHRRGDVEWILDHADPSIEIVQPAELPDPRTYRGHDGLLDAYLDWPSHWERLEFEPRRVFAVGDEHVITVAVHRGRARRVEIEVAAEITWLVRWRDERAIRWDMFMSADDALAAAERRE
jgi:ketosteroid isomerase-like protein